MRPPKSDREPPDDVELLKAHWHVMRGTLLGLAGLDDSEAATAKRIVDLALAGIMEPGYTLPGDEPPPPTLRVVE